jgi:predicted DNA-binding transcriptional regulator YafY
MADPLERLVNLVALLLETPQPLTLEQIAAEMPGQYPEGPEARRGAFERDKRALRDLGIPLEGDVLTGDRAGATGYWIDRERYELPDLGLSDDERTALRAALAAVHVGMAGAEDALVKVGAAGAADAAVTAALAPLEHLPVLFEASTAHAPVRFRYREEERTLDLYALLNRDGFWYAAGRDHRSGSLRTFRVDRMEGPLGLGAPDSYAVPPGFGASDALPDDPKAIGAERVEALVLVDAVRATKVVREVGDDAVVEHRTDGGVVLQVPATNRPAFRSWVLGLLDHAEVLGPPEVRDDLVAWLAAIAAGRP